MAEQVVYLLTRTNPPWPDDIYNIHICVRFYNVTLTYINDLHD